MKKLARLQVWVNSHKSCNEVRWLSLFKHLLAKGMARFMHSFLTWIGRTRHYFRFRSVLILAVRGIFSCYMKNKVLLIVFVQYILWDSVRSNSRIKREIDLAYSCIPSKSTYPLSFVVLYLLFNVFGFISFLFLYKVFLYVF